VISFVNGPDAIEAKVTDEVDALGIWSRSGLGSVEFVLQVLQRRSLTALDRLFRYPRWIVCFATRAGSFVSLTAK
jgi:hypothetical protein